MRLKIAAGNWKMNKTYEEGLQLVREIKDATSHKEGRHVIIGTPFIHLKDAVKILIDSPWVDVAAQNCHQAEKGAYTGEISTSMLQSIGVNYVILGHSERRQYFHETNETLIQKVDAVLGAGMTPIFCCGESLDIRNEGWHARYVNGQLEKSLFHLHESEFKKLIIAYEPIWAIGTGVTASPEQAQEMHASIRGFISDRYGKEIASNLTILYGGSVKPANAAQLFAQPDVDGGLVGGASLTCENFLPIINQL